MSTMVQEQAVVCERCHRPFHAYYDKHRKEDDLISILNSGKCMRCAIRSRVPQSWNPNELGARGRNEYKLKRQKEGKK